MSDHARRPERAAAGGHPPGSPGPPMLDPWWAPEGAAALARTLGVDPLGDRHWKVIMACREEAARTGLPPDAATLSRLTGVDPAELRLLFPGDFARTLARIAGLHSPL